MCATLRGNGEGVVEALKASVVAAKATRKPVSVAASATVKRSLGKGSTQRDWSRISQFCGSTRSTRSGGALLVSPQAAKSHAKGSAHSSAGRHTMGRPAPG